MKNYKNQIILLFGAIAMVSYLSVRYMPEMNPDNISVLKEQNVEQMQIYVLDKDNTLIPMSKEIPIGMSIEEKISTMISSMCADQVSGSFSGVLGQGTLLHKVQVEEGKASLYFDDTFLTYGIEQELRVLEALVWGTTQFADIQDVDIYINEALISKMPLASTPIPETLNRTLGINHFESATSALHHGDTITVFYTKELDGTSYFVPKSKRIEGSKEDMEVVVKEVLKDVSISSSLAQPLYEDNIDSLDLPKRKDDTLIVNMNHNLLDSDRSAKQKAYETLVLSLSINFDADKIMVYVDENVVSLHGSNEEALSVSSLIYNPIPF